MPLPTCRNWSVEFVQSPDVERGFSVPDGPLRRFRRGLHNRSRANDPWLHRDLEGVWFHEVFGAIPGASDIDTVLAGNRNVHVKIVDARVPGERDLSCSEHGAVATAKAVWVCLFRGIRRRAHYGRDVSRVVGARKVAGQIVEVVTTDELDTVFPSEERWMRDVGLCEGHPRVPKVILHRPLTHLVRGVARSER